MAFTGWAGRRAPIGEKKRSVVRTEEGLLTNPSPHLPPIALTAPTRSVRVDVGIGRRVLVAMFATGLERCRALGVRAVRDDFEMGRVDARSIAAEVVKLHSIWDRADFEFVNKAVGGYGLCVSPTVDVSVASRVDVSTPQPAVIGDLNLRHEAFFGGKLGLHRDLLSRGVIGQAVRAALPFYFTSSGARA